MPVLLLFLAAAAAAPLALLLPAAPAAYALKATGSPIGQAAAAGVTGGGDQTPMIPTTNAELITMLQGTTPRVIQLTKVFDFTAAQGTVTAQGCSPWSCSPSPQQAINSVNYCANQPAATITYNKQALAPLAVGSNISILGSGANAGLKGVGLKISGSSNVIVQNIKITDLNAQFVWGGDAFTVVGSTGVWIDHCFTQNIGRMQLVMGYAASKGVTISNNEFNGVTNFSPYCNNKSYWIMLLVGINDEITIAQNLIHDSSGRGPHIGGTAGYVQKLHLVNNYYTTVDGHAIDPELGSLTLAEGNVFNAVKLPVTTNLDGKLFFPQTAADAAACTAALGRACVPNSVTGGSGAVSRLETDPLSSFSGVAAVSGPSPPLSPPTPASESSPPPPPPAPSSKSSTAAAVVAPATSKPASTPAAAVATTTPSTPATGGGTTTTLTVGVGFTGCWPATGGTQAAFTLNIDPPPTAETGLPPRLSLLLDLPHRNLDPLERRLPNPGAVLSFPLSVACVGNALSPGVTVKVKATVGGVAARVVSTVAGITAGIQATSLMKIGGRRYFLDPRGLHRGLLDFLLRRLPRTRFHADLAVAEREREGLLLVYNEWAMVAPVDCASTDFPRWWKDSELELKHDNRVVFEASRNGQPRVPQWWKESRLPLDYDAKPDQSKSEWSVGKDRLRIFANVGAASSNP
ncbi:pectin lyase fold/virulence factor [Zopfochytrium polystomum]|nr:pectin lyase fold/virulence factor [Zopfochytrium polystomum]